MGSGFTITMLLIAVSILGVVAFGILVVAFVIHRRLGELVAELATLRALAVGNQGELVQAKEGIGRMHGDISRLVANSNRTAEIARGNSRLPTR